MKKILLMALLLTMFLGMHAQTGMRMLITHGAAVTRGEQLARLP